MIIAVIGRDRLTIDPGIVSDWMDILSIYICPLRAGLAGIMFFWVCARHLWKNRSPEENHMYHGIIRYVNIFMFSMFYCVNLELTWRNRVEKAKEEQEMS